MLAIEDRNESEAPNTGPDRRVDKLGIGAVVDLVKGRAPSEVMDTDGRERNVDVIK
jgi:hypothetical protein